MSGNGNQLLIPPDSKSRGKPLSEIAKQERPQPLTSSPLQRQQPLTGKIITLAEYKDSKGMTQEETLAEANKQGKTLVTNLWADEDLNKNDGLTQRSSTYPIWTGIMAAYEKPNTALKDKIIYTDSSSKITYIFNVPQQFQGEKNCILCIAHGFINGTPTFTHAQTPEGMLIQVADQSLIALIKNYNKADGWYLPESQFGIPVGAASDSNNKAARYSYRINDGSYIVLVARGDGIDGGRRGVGAGSQPSDRFGVLVHG